MPWSKINIAKRSLFALIFVVSSVRADDLMQVYNQALKNDPIFAQAESTWNSQKMAIPIAESGYLPQLSIASDATRDYLHNEPDVSSTNTDYSWQYGYALTATQAIFNGVDWAKIKGADATVKSATATYLSAEQSLMQRTVTDYFAVLLAYDQLRFTIGEKRDLWHQYLNAKEQFEAGKIAITDANNALADYDQAVTDQVAAENNLNVQLENLRSLTGRSYYSLRGLGERLPLIKPKPVNINTWVKVASKQNYGLIAQNDNVQVAMELIKQEAAGGYPTLGLQGGVGELHITDSSPSTAQDTASLGLNLSYAPIQGGLVDASTKQARYNYVTASGLLEQTYRQVVNQARTGFLGVVANITQIKADKQNVISSRASLNSTEGGYEAGTRNMQDLVQALTKLYQAQVQYATDQYSYINNFISLKDAAGTLNISDLEEINSWLSKSIYFPEQMIVATMPTPHDNKNIIMHNETHPGKITKKVILEDTTTKTESENKKISDGKNTAQHLTIVHQSQPQLIPPPALALPQPEVT